MLTKNNWAFFISKNDVIWHFPPVENPEFAESLLRLTKALQSFGEEFLGDAIGTITIGKSDEKSIETLVVLFIRLSQDMYLVISQPSTTALLLELAESYQMPEELRDQVRGVLVGAALSTYSKFWGSELYEMFQPQIDDIFKQCITMIGAEQRATIGDGTCSLAELTMPELILFHHYLQKSLQDRSEFQSQKEWSLIADKAGAPIHLIWNLEEQFATSLAGLLCVINAFTTHSFGYKPLEMTFGISNVIKLSFFNGNDNFCAMAQPKQLLKRPSFNKALLQVEQGVLSDIQPELRAFIEKEIAIEYALSLKSLDFSSLLSRFSVNFPEDSQEPMVTHEHVLQQVSTFIEEMHSFSKRNADINNDMKDREPQPHQILVLGSTERIKDLFQKQLIVTNSRTLEVDEFSFDMIEVAEEINNSKETFQFWFVKPSYLDTLKFYILSSTLFNTDCLIVPYSFKEKKWLPPITRYIENYWNHSGKSAINTIILLLEGNEEHIYYKEAHVHYSQLRKSIRQPKRIQFLPISHPTKKAFTTLLNLIVALKKIDENTSTTDMAE